MDNTLPEYEKLKRIVNEQINTPEALGAIKEIYNKSNAFLNGREKIDLISKVENKNYFSLKYNNRVSRPINRDVFINSAQYMQDFFNALENV